ncbi:MAG: hypothetical protein ABIO50_08430 [Nitrosospira sp.]
MMLHRDTRACRFTRVSVGLAVATANRSVLFGADAGYGLAGSLRIVNFALPGTDLTVLRIGA